MSNLTDRYVWAVLRAVPSSQRAELEQEIRALVDDAVEARRSAGEPADTAERSALTELGDPTVLAARYSERPQHLIGPTIYPHWQRLLTLLLPIIVPILFAVVLGANLIGERPVGESIVAAGSAAISVAIQTVFWITLVFVVIERVAVDEVAAHRWTPDDLPELPDPGRLPVSELIGVLVANGIVAVGLLWVQLQPPTVIDGVSFPLFDPALWSFWLPWFLGVIVAEVLLAIVVFVRGRWTYPLAATNAVLGAAFAVPAVYLLQNDLLFNPQLINKLREATDGGAWIDVTAVIIGVSVVAVVTWDAIDAFRKARRAANPALRGPAPA